MKIEPLFNEIFLIRLLINTGAMIILIRFIYYHIYQEREIFFTFFLLSFVVFILAIMLQKSSAFGSISNAGTAFGLLAAFSLLRFRTETISAKDMTYSLNHKELSIRTGLNIQRISIAHNDLFKDKVESKIY